MALNGARWDRSRQPAYHGRGTPKHALHPERTRDFVRQALDALRSLPGVESAAAGNSLPIIGAARGGTGFHRLGTPQTAPNRSPITIVAWSRRATSARCGFRSCAGGSSTTATRQLASSSTKTFARAYLENVDPLATSISVRMQRENPYLPIVGSSATSPAVRCAVRRARRCTTATGRCRSRACRSSSERHSRRALRSRRRHAARTRCEPGGHLGAYSRDSADRKHRARAPQRAGLRHFRPERTSARRAGALRPSRLLRHGADEGNRHQDLARGAARSRHGLGGRQRTAARCSGLVRGVRRVIAARPLATC